ncbi:probable long-chain-alcohol O-fatty-acyltransferase 5 [Aristolochia californica]|uniref:probable long-chain-alcohol O-fatty-acyltransferase 5 n=1 Tax=Aristolochia californica TaxID=171875 RepID=UPI0035DA6803
MEELKSLAKVCLSVNAALIYCYFFVSQIRPGKTRLLFLLPVFYLFSVLPWTFSSLHFRGISAFFLTWLGIFKLLLFAFDQGPLATQRDSFVNFACIASLPVKYKQRKPSLKSNSYPGKIPISLFIKGLALSAVIYLYKYKSNFHHKILLSLYCFHLFLALELVLAAGAAVARSAVDLELEPQSDEPYLSTSLQDFWGRRWNLMVTSILRPTIYSPIRRWASPKVGGRRARLLGIVAVFLVSGLMHEVMFYYLTLAEMTWEVTWFFMLHGFCTGAEVAVKESLARKFWLPVAVSRLATLVFVAVTGFWLFFPAILRSRSDEKVIDEYGVFLEFLMDRGQNLRAWIRG